MTLPADIAEAVAALTAGPAARVVPVGGGCIAQACRVEAGGTSYFLKWSTRREVSETFPAEQAGLRALGAAESPLRIPVPLGGRAAAAGAGFLLMEWVEAGETSPAFWGRLGEGLAALHRHTGPAYGFAIDNFIGRLPQENTWTDDWVRFFLERRLLPQAERAQAGGAWPAAWDGPFELLCKRLPTLLPDSPPASMLHGDLWSGNVLADTESRPVLIDPAAYYGHREADLAMTELFGGFDARFYDAYRAAWPLAPGYEERREVYNLYHLLNHLNHFGSGYAGAVDRTLRAFG